MWTGYWIFRNGNRYCFTDDRKHAEGISGYLIKNGENSTIEEIEVLTARERLERRCKN